MMDSLKDRAASLVVSEFAMFADQHDEYYFHPMERDYWVRRFCEWLMEKQRKSAEVRASND